MKRNQFKRFTAFLLLLCLLTALLCGCQNNEDNPSQTPSTDGTTVPAGSSEPSSEPIKQTEPSTAPSTAPTEPSTQPTEPSTEPTEPSTQPTTPPTEPSTEPTFPGVTWESVGETVYATTAVNVRSGPGTSYEKISQLQQGQAVLRVALGSNGWSKIAFNGGYAYVSSNYLSTQQTQPVETQPVTPPSNNTQGDKVIYLTFDDGPGTRTPELLALLEKYDVKVTFFVMGDGELQYLDDIANAGHAIGIHTYSHDYEEIYASTDAFWADFYKMEDIIYQYTGIHTNLHRFPGGSSNSISKRLCPGIMTELTQEIQNRGYYYFDWNVDSDDAGSARTADEVYNNVISTLKTKGHSVVLMHDVKSYTIDAIERIIQWGLQNGYTFLPLDENAPVTHHTVRN